MDSRPGVLVHFYDVDTSGVLVKLKDPSAEKCLKLHEIKYVGLQKKPVILKNSYQNIIKIKFVMVICKLAC